MTHPQTTVNQMIKVLTSLVNTVKVDSLSADAFIEAETLLKELNETPLYVNDPDKDKYNGWHNYETWVVNLWIGDNSDDLVEELITAPDGSPSDIYELSKRLRDYVEDMSPLADDASMFSDLLGGALSDCNWYEIAEHWMIDYMENHPIIGTKANPAEYNVSPSMPTVADENHPFWAESDEITEECESFWKAFNICIENAIDNDYTSIVIRYSINEIDVTYADGWRADRLIEQQNERNTKITGE